MLAVDRKQLIDKCWPNNVRAMKMHYPENWICKPFEQAPIVQQLLKISENFQDHCTHH